MFRTTLLESRNTGGSITVLIFVLRALACIFLTASTVRCATLSGTVLDPQGRTISGAAVSIVRRSDAARWDTIADTQGRFSVTDLKPSEYCLIAGFTVFG